MKTERKFTTPVSMVCTKEQFEVDLKERLESFGYKVHTDEQFDVFPLIVNNIHGYLGSVGNATADRDSSLGRHFINHYNPNLFLALAAMSEGDEFWPGEYICSAMFPDRLSRVSLVTEKCITVGLGMEINLPEKRIRKASKEEILAHFTQQEQYQQEELKKPPIGLPPSWIWIEHRANDLSQAITRYINAGMAIPENWRQEAEWLDKVMENRLRNRIDVFSPQQEPAGISTTDPLADPLWDEILNHKEPEKSQVNHPEHYGGPDNPYEAIKIIEAMGWGYEFCMGNVVKYTMRAGKKEGEAKEKDEAKSNWYLNRANEIKAKLGK